MRRREFPNSGQKASGTTAGRFASRLRILAQSVSLPGARTCPELEVKPTCRLNARSSQF